MAARLTPEVRALRAITERQWQATVERLMTAHGWHYYHAPDNSPRVSRGGMKYVQNVKAGWPDLVAVKGTKMIAVELKREQGKTTAEQDAWLTKLSEAGVETAVWRPRDLAEVRKILGEENA